MTDFKTKSCASENVNVQKLETEENKSNSQKESKIETLERDETKPKESEKTEEKQKNVGSEQAKSQNIKDQQVEVQQEDTQQAGIKKSKSKQDGSKEEEDETEEQSKRSTEIAQGTLTIKRENDASKINTAEINEAVPIRHPRLPATTPPRYFINKDGVVFSNATRKLKPKKPQHGSNMDNHVLYVDNYKSSTFKLEEIMAYTFSEHYDSKKHYILHKDGQQSNCAWDNLIICEDFATLQQEAIAMLERLNPGTKYTVVRNVHDTLTFERYLVSDTGKVYSLVKRGHIQTLENEHGYMQVHLTCDAPSRQSAWSVTPWLHRVVMQSFNGRRPKTSNIIHLNGNKRDDSLENLAYTDSIKDERPTRKKTAAESVRRVSRKIMPVPLPPITDETRWKTIGVLPWNGQSYSHHEVSDLGHVRVKENSQLVKLSCGSNGYVSVSIHPDNPGERAWPRSLYVSRLVASAFVDGYSEERNAVKHLNGDRLDNRAQNLQWISMRSSALLRVARPVIASLLDDPTLQKKFTSMTQAQHELRTYNFAQHAAVRGNPYTAMVNWDGEKRMASIQVLPSKMDEE